jgi:hypothetical protein
LVLELLAYLISSLEFKKNAYFVAVLKYFVLLRIQCK